MCLRISSRPLVRSTLAEEKDEEQEKEKKILKRKDKQVN